MNAPAWHLYIVRCGDGSLYTGVTTDVQRRLAEHRAGTAGRGARFLRGRGPLTLAFSASVADRSAALRLERRVKRLPRAGKEALIRAGVLPGPSGGGDAR